MYICPNCQNTSDTPINFCSKCGTPMIEKAPEAPVYAAQPAPEAPAYAAPEAPAYAAPEAPAYTAQPAPEAPAYTAPQPTSVYTAPQPVSIPYAPEKKVPLGKVIAGMAIAIGGIFFAAISLLVTLGTLDTDPEVAFGMSFAYGGFFGFPLSLVGLILSKGAVNAGSKSGMAKAGKILGLIGVILAAASLSLGFIALIAEM